MCFKDKDIFHKRSENEEEKNWKLFSKWKLLKRNFLRAFFVFIFLVAILCCIKDGKVPLFLCHSLRKFNFWSILSSLLSTREWNQNALVVIIIIVFCEAFSYFSLFFASNPKGVKEIKFSFLFLLCTTTLSSFFKNKNFSIQIAKGDEKSHCVHFTMRIQWKKIFVVRIKRWPALL